MTGEASSHKSTRATLGSFTGILCLSIHLSTAGCSCHLVMDLLAINYGHEPVSLSLSVGAKLALLMLER